MRMRTNVKTFEIETTILFYHRRIIASIFQRSNKTKIRSSEICLQIHKVFMGGNCPQRNANLSFFANE